MTDNLDHLDSGRLNSEPDQYDQVSLGVAVSSMIVELLKVVAISAVIVVPIRVFLFQPFLVEGASMEPNFSDGQYLVVYPLPYKLQEVPEMNRGQAVIFRNPLDRAKFFIKRVVGLPGERVSIKKGQVYIYNKEYPQGVVLDESYYLKSEISTSGADFVDLVLESDQVFVLGDNRQVSFDSRKFGALDISDIVGNAWLRGWPIDKLGVVAPATYLNN